MPIRPWVAGVPQALTLPPALAGSGGKTYTLTPAPPPGLSFSGRVLSGTPSTAAAAAAYTYTATDSSGTSVSTNFTLALATLLPAPANLAATPVNGGVALSWGAPSGIGVTYEYRQRTIGGYSGWIGTDASPLEVSGLTGCTTFHLRARFGSVLGEASEEVQAAPLDGLPCSIKLRLRVFLEGPLR